MGGFFFRFPLKPGFLKKKHTHTHKHNSRAKRGFLSPAGYVVFESVPLFAWNQRETKRKASGNSGTYQYACHCSRASVTPGACQIWGAVMAISSIGAHLGCSIVSIHLASFKSTGWENVTFGGLKREGSPFATINLCSSFQLQPAARICPSNGPCIPMAGEGLLLGWGRWPLAY